MLTRRGFLGVLTGALASHAVNRVYFIPRTVKLYQAVPIDAELCAAAQRLYLSNPRNARFTACVTLADIQAIELEHFRREIPTIFKSGHTLFDKFAGARSSFQEVTDAVRHQLHEQATKSWMDLLPTEEDFDL